MCSRKWKKAASTSKVEPSLLLRPIPVKTFLPFLLLVCLGGGAAAQVPLRLPPAPLLEIYEAKAKGEQMTQLGYDLRHPMMIIRTVKSVQLARDDKGVMLVLTDEDAKALADVTRDFDERPLIFKSGDVTRPITVKGVVADGHVGFKYPEADAMAEQLRRYFYLAEFARASDPPPVR